MPVTRAGSPFPVSAAFSPRTAESASNDVLRRFQSTKLSVLMPLREVGSGASQTRTIRSGSGYGSGFNSTASMRLNIAVLAPMPMAMTLTATKANPGSRRSRSSP